MTSKNLSLLGLITAVTFIVTMLFKIPIPGGVGYVNLGDGAIFVFSAIFKIPFVYLAAGLGSAMADVSLGYAAFAIPTFIIKTSMSFVIYKIADNKPYSIKTLGSIFIAILIMNFGYFVATYFMFGYAAAIGDVLFNIVQSFAGLVLYLAVSPYMFKIKNYGVNLE